MPDFQPKILTTFESSDGLTVLTFPRAEYEWESSQDLYTPAAEVVGAGYIYDQLGSGSPIKKVGMETLRFVVVQDNPATVDSDVDALIAGCISIGRGKLYTTDSAGTRRWAWARAVSLPSLRWSRGDIFTKQASMAFRRQSDWYATSQTSVIGTLNGSPDSFTVTNPGTQRVWNAVIILKGTWTAPVTILNETTGYAYSYDDGDDGNSANDWVRFDSGSGRVFRSTDGGTTWSDADAYITLGSGQAQQMRIDPGDNTFTFSDLGTPSGTLTVQFYGAN